MNHLLLILVIANVLISGGLFYLWHRSHKHSIALEAESKALQQASNAIPADLKNIIGAKSKRLITVEILNPIELATKRTWLAKPLASMSPGAIDNMVYKEARNMIAEKLVDFDVKAEVQIYHDKS